MSRITLIDLEEEYYRLRKHYVEKAEDYLKEMKKICKSLDPNCELIVFGSYVKRRMRIDSDIDVIVITEKAPDPSYRARIFIEIARRIGEVTPFQIHIVTKKEYREWYSKFIDSWREI